VNLAPGRDAARASIDQTRSVPMSADEKRAGMARFAWYHTIDLGDGVLTPGLYDHRPILGRYRLPDDLRGMSALDVGPAHGFFAFELEARGAHPVITAELPSWSAHDASPTLRDTFRAEDADTTHSDYLRGALAFAIAARASAVRQQFVNVYDLSPETVGEFDLVFCASVLLHLTDPLRALYAIRSVTRGSAIIATAIQRDPFDRRPQALFVGEPQGQVFWLPNMRALEQLCLAAGFARCERGDRFRVRSRDGRYDDLHGVVQAWPS
jgi:tRNA (mo5U34)-methyltransferase